jgi:integrase
MPKKAVRVLGPYRNGVNFRVVVIEGGRRKSITAATQAQAQALMQSLDGELRSRRTLTVGEAMEEYIEHRVHDRGILPLTVTELRRLLQDFLPSAAPLASLSADDARRLYSELSGRQTARGTPISPSTHHVMLRRTRAFFRWAVERGYVQQNPFAAVKPIGHSRAGKTQLTIDEARQWKALALKQACAGDPAALGVLLLLLLGLRAGEVLGRAARDVDDDARVLWITRGKTKNARRRLEVPEEIQQPLRRLVENKAPHELIFGTSRKGGPRNKGYLWFKVQALCDAAGVPRVSSHSLRGLHSTLALEAGATPHLVAAALGHASFRVTARHYANPSTLLNPRSRRVASALLSRDDHESEEAAEKSAPDHDSTDELRAFLAGLSVEQQDRLRKLLDSAKA